MYRGKGRGVVANSNNTTTSLLPLCILFPSPIIYTVSTFSFVSLDPGPRCSRDDKFLLVYTLLKLGLVKGKTLIFVNEIDQCYRYGRLHFNTVVS